MTKAIAPSLLRRAWRVLRLPSLLGGAALAASVSVAGPPAPYRGTFSSSRDGAWYVAVSGGGTFQLVKRGVGLGPRTLPAMGPAESIDVLPEPGDEVVCLGACGRPERVLCMNGGAGFIAFEEWGAESQGRVFSRYDRLGREQWTHSLATLFGQTVAKSFARGVGITLWSRDWWLSKDEQWIAVLALPNRAVYIEMDSGRVGVPGLVQLRDALERRDWPNADVLLQHHNASTGAAISPDEARQAIAGGGLPTGIVLRLYGLVGPAATGAERESFVALLDHASAEDLAIGLGLLPALSRDKALPILLRNLGKPSPVAEGVVEGFSRLGEDGLESLARVAIDPVGDPEVRSHSIEALGALGRRSEAAIAVLKRVVVEDPDARTKSRAIRALVASKSALARPLLAETLAHGRIDELHLIEYFVADPRRDAASALIAALRRHASDDLWRPVILEGLAKATGQNLGARPEAWEDWLRSHPD